MGKKNYARVFGQDLMRGEHKVKRESKMKGYKQAEKENLEHEVSVTGTSIFDPVLCELVYRWFLPPTGYVLDPFAGGSVRGIVAAMLDHPYIGIDLRPEQNEANQKQWGRISQNNYASDKPTPQWVTGNGLNVRGLAGDRKYDLVFTCPPYGDLEVYSDNPEDISTMSYDEFIETFAKIMQRSLFLLKDNRFACVVVGDFRDKRGFYYNFPAHTIDLMQKAGARLYNEAILITAVGSLPIRAGKQFTSGRKLGKTHQNILIFYKGDPKKIKGDFGEVIG